MTRLLLLPLFCASLILGSIALGGCNMMEGIGKDTKETGDFISGTPRRDAYHVDARDF